MIYGSDRKSKFSDMEVGKERRVSELVPVLKRG